MRLSILILALLLPGCAGLLNATVPTGALRITHDLTYGDLPRQRADVYRPSVAHAPLPIIVFLYGGSWKTGNKDIYRFAAAAMARRGAVVVVPDYRLYPQVRYPTFLEDCARATVWAQAHATAWGGDPRRLVVMGHSAGAYNGAMLVTDRSLLSDQGGDIGRIAGFVGLSGPYDFLPITDPDIIPIFPHDDPASMPVDHVAPGMPSMLLLTGADDHTVMPRNTYSLAQHVRAAGGQAEVITYPNTAHIGIILDMAAPFRHRAPVLRDVMAFVTTIPPAARSVVVK